MRHVTVEQFHESYDKLPLAVRRLADHNFTVIKQYPDHPLLRKLQIDDIVSVRVGSRHRALAVTKGETMIWFWIGNYKQYTTLLQ
jgi:hypothetical protein